MKAWSNMMVAAAVLAACVLLVGGCKKTYFNLTDESHPAPLRFTTTESYCQMGRSFTVEQGKYSLTSGDNTVLYIEGRSIVREENQGSVATMDLTKTARIYMVLPLNPELKRYDAGFHSICEVVGGGMYTEGNNLFECRSAELALDSLKHGNYYGSFSGEYTNAEGRVVKIDGAIRAGRK
ncbi:MAG: hypothetical protein PHR28_06380 [candidate division Zixibacteria bacterium]|nr:hypothetical protein [candidate division Zixibacteria bacterium]